MPVFELKDPAATPLPEDPFERDARLLCEGKLIKDLRKRKYTEPLIYATYAAVAQAVADIENASTPHLPAHTATWRKTYAGKSSNISTLVSLFSPLGLLLAASKNETYECETIHHLDPRHSHNYWLRRLCTQAGALIFGTSTILSIIFALIVLLSMGIEEQMSRYSASDVISLLLLSILSAVAYYKIRILAPPSPLRMYAGGTFELVKLKRVKVPQE
ncbi:hypothetical protein [Ruficoccus sp. ZRK36]|uniref:hypothetical protein n=1 Tax=Ruficoccus sp. ZRK36 TaxID=2866311 RepID=UPI001C73B352|nr:hypothetical protein [Ruficoccus sp. ZRK36]QYY35969.1 hypothetical protein K0V07_00505 [Ruficoccus sp. ZRK36]